MRNVNKSFYSLWGEFLSIYLNTLQSFLEMRKKDKVLCGNRANYSKEYDTVRHISVVLAMVVKALYQIQQSCSWWRTREKEQRKATKWFYYSIPNSHRLFLSSIIYAAVEADDHWIGSSTGDHAKFHSLGKTLER